MAKAVVEDALPFVRARSCRNPATESLEDAAIFAAAAWPIGPRCKLPLRNPDDGGLLLLLPLLLEEEEETTPNPQLFSMSTFPVLDGSRFS